MFIVIGDTALIVARQMLVDALVRLNHGASRIVLLVVQLAF